MAAPNQALHLTGAAILVSRGLMSLQAAPGRCAWSFGGWWQLESIIGSESASDRPHNG